MDDLIKIEKDSKGVETVNARDLHKFLESKQQFTNWIQNRIEQYQFIEGTDFIKLNKFINSDSKPTDQYFLTIDMAKQVSMVERNHKGHEIRLWFIDRENKLRQIESNIIQIDPAKNQPEVLQLAADQAKQLKEQAPLVHIANEFLSVENTLKGTDEIARELGIGEITLFKILREKKFFHYVYQNKKRVNVPYQIHIDAGRVVVKNRTADIGTDDEEKKINYSRSYFTPKGEAYVCHLVKNWKAKQAREKFFNKQKKKTKEN